MGGENRSLIDVIVQKSLHTTYNRAVALHPTIYLRDYEDYQRYFFLHATFVDKGTFKDSVTHIIKFYSNIMRRKRSQEKGNKYRYVMVVGLFWIIKLPQTE